MIASLSNQLSVGPSSRMYSSAPRKPAMVKKPGQSNFSSSLKSGLSKSIVNHVTVVTTIPGNTLTRNSQCQE